MIEIVAKMYDRILLYQVTSTKSTIRDQELQLKCNNLVAQVTPC